jgi:cytochrome P450
MQHTAMQCPINHEPAPASQHYTVTGGPKGLPVFGPLFEALKNPIAFMMQNALQYGDIVPYKMAGMNILQINHPDLIRYVLLENHKNYYKSDAYIRFESVLGKGLLTSNGDKWKRDRQKIQPMFKREEVEGYYYTIVNEVSEKYKQRWLKLTEHGSAEINISAEMAAITIEVILKSIFGKDNLDEATIRSLHYSYGVFIEYLKDLRLLPKVDMRKMLHTPAYYKFKKELVNVETILKNLAAKYRSEAFPDKNNMLALLIEAQKADPKNFSEIDIRDHSVSMVFAGYETTSILMQWMWYALDSHPDTVAKLREEIARNAPCTLEKDSLSLTYDQVNRNHYLTAVYMETMRLYPPFWGTSRCNITDDKFGDYHVPKGTTIILPQSIMHRHPRWWANPNAFIPERFLPENEKKIEEGAYFPFSHGPRKCSGFKLVEMEAKTIFTKLLPMFNVTAINTFANHLDASISLKLTHPLRVSITRR